MSNIGKITIIYIIISIIISLSQVAGELLLSQTISYVFEFLMRGISKLLILGGATSEYNVYYAIIGTILGILVYLLAAIYTVVAYLIIPLIIFRIINIYIAYNKEIKLQVNTNLTIEIKLLITWLSFYVLSNIFSIFGITEIILFPIKVIILYYLLSNNFFNYGITNNSSFG